MTGSKSSTGKGKCLIIVVHIGLSEGFIANGFLCFKLKKKYSRLLQLNEWQYISRMVLWYFAIIERQSCYRYGQRAILFGKPRTNAYH